MRRCLFRSILISVFSFQLLYCFENDQSRPDRSSRFTFLPGKLAVQPLTASYKEPRFGVRKEIGTSKLKLDIGASVDMLEFQPSSDSTDRIRIGVEFFTYALATNSEGLRLQIDAVDGYFGGHVAYRSDFDDVTRFILRLRLLHISAHFLDGHYNNLTNSWKDNRDPIPFTRDFGELMAMYDFRLGALNCKLYGGFNYATLVRPTNINRFEADAGIEFHSSDVLKSVFGKPFNVYLADNFGLRGIPSYIGTNNLEFGVKFGAWSATGLKIYFSYYNGLDVYSQYYDVRRENWGIGVAFYFW